MKTQNELQHEHISRFEFVYSVCAHAFSIEFFLPSDSIFSLLWLYLLSTLACRHFCEFVIIKKYDQIYARL